MFYEIINMCVCYQTYWNNNFYFFYIEYEYNIIKK